MGINLDKFNQKRYGTWSVNVDDFISKKIYKIVKELNDKNNLAHIFNSVMLLKLH